MTTTRTTTTVDQLLNAVQETVRAAERAATLVSEGRPAAARDEILEAQVLLADAVADTRRRNAANSNGAQPDPGRVEPAIRLYTNAEDLLAALLLSGAYGAELSARTLEEVRAETTTTAAFERERDRAIYAAIEAVVDRGEPSIYKTVEAELVARRRLDTAGGPLYLVELAKAAPAVENARHYARLVVREARLRDQERVAAELLEAARGGAVSAELRDRVVRIVEQDIEPGPAPEAVQGGSFVFDEPTDPAQIRVWGEETQIGWASGEGLMLIGPDGVGKTTLGQQIALARTGLRDNVLGMHVAAAGRRLLYIAADRPRQAARSMRRMVSDLDRAGLDERMTVWRGPLPAMLNEDRTILARLCKHYDADTVVVDSLKDVAVDIASDEAGGRIASCFQHVIASGVELLVMHHPRKPGVDQHRKPRELADSYGSRLIYGVFGSVVMLWGNPGDPIVELSHLKQPLDEIGPWNLHHDHQVGHTTVDHGTDLVQLVLNASTAGLTAAAAAGLIYQKDSPTPNEIERTRGKLKRLCKNGRILEMPGRKGAGTGNHGGAAIETLYVFNGPAEALL